MLRGMFGLPQDVEKARYFLERGAEAEWRFDFVWFHFGKQDSSKHLVTLSFVMGAGKNQTEQGSRGLSCQV